MKKIIGKKSLAIILTLFVVMFIGSKCVCAELFPNNGSFTLLWEKFPSNPVVMLKNGELFFPGGVWSGTGVIEPARLYNIKTKKLKLVGHNMNIPRISYTTVLLQDGRVLINGGYAINEKGNMEHKKIVDEIYNPATKTFSEISENYSGYSHSHCVLLKDGRVFIISAGLATIFDPKVEKYTVVGNIRQFKFKSYITGSPDQIAEYSTLHQYTDVRPVLLKDGRVLLVGNSYDNNGNAEIYDPKINLFTNTGQMKYPRSQFTATLLSDGRVLVIGGVNKDWEYGIGTAEIFDPKTNSFKTVGSLKVPRYDQSAILLSNGKVLVVNGKYGHSEDLKYLKDAELFDPKTNIFIKIGSTHKTRVYPDLINISKNQIFVLSGKDAEIYKY